LIREVNKVQVDLTNGVNKVLADLISEVNKVQVDLTNGVNKVLVDLTNGVNKVLVDLISEVFQLQALGRRGHPAGIGGSMERIATKMTLNMTVGGETVWTMEHHKDNSRAIKDQEEGLPHGSTILKTIKVKKETRPL